jgi:polar amino acid transport system substrate-binding protein
MLFPQADHFPFDFQIISIADKEEPVKRQTTYVFLGLIVLSLLLGACAQPAATATPPPAPAETEAPTAMTTEKIRVASDATWPPFEMVDEASKEVVGFDIDLLNAIAEKAGLEVEIINVAFDPLLAGIATCQYDAAISAMTITEERKKDMLFSDPYFEAGQVVTVQASNTDITGKDSLAGKSVGAQIGTTGAIETEKLGANLKTYDEIGLAYQDLINGQVDAVIADNPLALGYVGQNPDKLKTVGEVFTDENYGIAICKNKPELQAKINEGLAAVKSEGLIDQFTQKWISASQ